jgi:hypothetical protein
MSTNTNYNQNQTDLADAAIKVSRESGLHGEPVEQRLAEQNDSLEAFGLLSMAPRTASEELARLGLISPSRDKHKHTFSM